jgi:hypothetical protein
LPKFHRQRFSQAGDIGFGGGVDGEVGNRHGSGERADVEDGRRALRGGFDVVQEGSGQQGERRDVEVDLAPDAIAAGVGEQSVVAEAGVVDEEVGFDGEVGDGLPEGVATGISGEIARADDKLQPGICSAEFGREGVHVFLGAGGEQQGVGMWGKLAGELRPKPRRGPGDERDRLLEGKPAKRRLVSRGGWGGVRHAIVLVMGLV